jgi:hypothetical protein
MYGIKETKEVIELMLAIGDGVAKSFKDDGKLTLGDIQHFTGALFLIPSAFAGIENVPHELKDLQENEVVEIKNLILTKMPDVGDKWEAVAANAILAAWHIYEVVKAFGKKEVAV